MEHRGECRRGGALQPLQEVRTEEEVEEEADAEREGDEARTSKDIA